MVDRNFKCDNCKKDIEVDKEGWVYGVRIQRGYFHFDFDKNGDINDEFHDGNVKFERWYCIKCFLEDIDLCKFFNKQGNTVR